MSHLQGQLGGPNAVTKIIAPLDSTLEAVLDAPETGVIVKLSVIGGVAVVTVTRTWGYKGSKTEQVASWTLDRKDPTEE